MPLGHSSGTGSKAGTGSSSQKTFSGLGFYNTPFSGNSGTAKFGPFSSIVGMGDSITFGANASSAPQQWINIFGSSLGATVFNQAISGTVLQNSNDSGGNPMVNNGRDRAFAAIGGINKRKALVGNYQYNDSRYVGAPSTFNVANWTNDMREFLNIAMELGYTPDSIALGTSYYITDTGLNTGSAGFSGQTRSGFTAYVDAAKSVYSEYNIFMADVYTAMLNNGAGALISGDNIHPNDTGHAVIAAAMLAATRPNTNVAPTLNVTSPTPGTINYTIGAVPGAVSYTIEYMGARGTYNFTGTVTGTNLTGSFTSLTPNLYTVRVRANFAGGSSGWVFKRVLSIDPTTFTTNFNGTAGTGITAVTPQAGLTYVVQSGYAPATESLLSGTGTVYSTTTAGIYRNQTQVILGDYSTQATLVFKSSIAGDFVGITGNASASANTFYFLAFNRTDNTGRLYRNNNGSNTLVKSWPMTFTSGSKVFKMTFKQMEGFLRVTAFIDGVQQDFYDDTSPLPFGYVGIRDATVKTATTGIHIQDHSFTLDPL